MTNTFVAAEDYSAGQHNFQLSFSNERKESNISIVIRQDEFSELQEDFFLMLDEVAFKDSLIGGFRRAELSGKRLKFRNTRTTIQIQDDDSA